MYPTLFTIPGINYEVKSFGFMMMIAFLSGTWLGLRRCLRLHQDPDVILNCALIALLAGVAGGRIFYVIHYWDEQFAFVPNPLFAAINIAAGGLEYYGGLIGAMTAISLYLLLTRKSFRVYMDLMIPSAMWGLGLGRIGCFLNGCCWGGLCMVAGTHEPAFPWAVTFPFGSPPMIRQWENRQLTLPSELIAGSPYDLIDPSPLGRDGLALSDSRRDKPRQEYLDAENKYQEARVKNPDSPETAKLKAARDAAERKRIEHDFTLGGLAQSMRHASRTDPTQRSGAHEIQGLAAAHRSLPVHPAQLYDTVNALLLSWLLTGLLYRRKRHGVVLGWMMILYPISRIIMELIRVDNPKDQIGGLTISQAVSLGMLSVGLIYMAVIYRLPLRSPRAKIYAPQPAPATVTA